MVSGEKITILSENLAFQIPFQVILVINGRQLEFRAEFKDLKIKKARVLDGSRGLIISSLDQNNPGFRSSSAFFNV